MLIIFSSLDEKQDHIYVLNSKDSDDKTLEIGSFDVPINYTVQIAALPLDQILVDGKIVSSGDCSYNNETIKPWLKCLESSFLEKRIDRCQNKFDISFTYSFENQQVYPMNIKPDVFKQTYNLKCMKIFLKFDNTSKS